MLGNNPFLDFINTRPMVDGQFIEQIPDGGSLLNLIGRLNLQDRPPVRRMATAESDEMATLARSMREDFRKFLFACKQDDRSIIDLTKVNRWFTSLGNPGVADQFGTLKLYYFNPEENIGSPELSAILRAGLDLVTSPQIDRVRKCANPDCMLWYLDVTKSRTRRWCSMSMCGNVDKARAFRQRHQTEQS